MPAEKDARLQGVVHRLQDAEIVVVRCPFVAIAIELRGLVQRVQEQVAEGDHGAGTRYTVKDFLVAMHDIGHGTCRGLQCLVLRIAQEVLGLLDKSVTGPGDAQQGERHQQQLEPDPMPETWTGHGYPCRSQR